MAAAGKSRFKLPKLRFWPLVMRRNFPRTLRARVLLIIVLPIVIMQIVILWVFFNLYWESTTARLTEGLVGDVSWAVSAYEQDPSPRNLERIKAQALKSMQLSVALRENEPLPEGRKDSPVVALDRSLNRALNEQLDQPYWFDAGRWPAWIDIRVKVKEGTLRFIAAKDRASTSMGLVFFYWILGTTAFLTTVAFLFIRNQVRAIERLAEAADRFGKGYEDPDFKPYGATEVRLAARAFLEMKARIQRQIEQRTTLLASVSHDLRTPLTRLKLELAMAPQDDAAERMKQDVSEMAYMIDEYLAFARGEVAENSEPTSVRALMTTIEENTRRAGHTLEVEHLPEDVSVNIRVQSIQRALINLVMNGFHYGKHVRLSADATVNAISGRRQLSLFIDDDGPGIAPEKREEAFKPFSRLDDARNQNIKGVGLGLAIARDIVRSHGGDLTLDQSPLGGLRAAITLPLD
jgi:two-component system osmolarity sensor histidine kinase EnvZ